MDIPKMARLIPCPICNQRYPDDYEECPHCWSKSHPQSPPLKRVPDPQNNQQSTQMPDVHCYKCGRKFGRHLMACPVCKAVNREYDGLRTFEALASAVDDSVRKDEMMSYVDNRFVTKSELGILRKDVRLGIGAILAGILINLLGTVIASSGGYDPGKSGLVLAMGVIAFLLMLGGLVHIYLTVGK